MRFHREIFMNTPEECQWLRDTHLASVVGYPPFASFMLAGPNDAPVRLDLYGVRQPAYNVYPIATVSKNDENEWACEAFIPPAKRTRARLSTTQTTPDTQEEPT